MTSCATASTASAHPGAGNQESGVRNEESEFGSDIREDEMAAVKSYQDLEIWQRSMALVTDCYRIAAALNIKPIRLLDLTP